MSYTACDFTADVLAELLAINRELVAALKDVIDLAEEEASSLGELGRDDADTAKYAEEAWTRIERAQAVIAKAEGR